jgi:predicted nucleotidyltransferase
VTTLDFDFMFRDTPINLRKLKAICRDLEAVILRPYYPVSKLYRMVNDERGLQVDLMPVIHGVRSFNSLRSRAVEVTLSGQRLLVAALGDIIASKRSAGRPRDLAVLDVLEKTHREKETPSQSSDLAPRRARRSGGGK